MEEVRFGSQCVGGHLQGCKGTTSSCLSYTSVNENTLLLGAFLEGQRITDNNNVSKRVEYLKWQEVLPTNSSSK